MEKGLARLRLRNQKKKRNRIRAAIILVILVVITCAICSSFEKGTVAITIKEGTTSIQIAQILKEEGVIHSKTLFLMRLAMSKYNSKLQYGTFKIDKEDSYGEIIETLATKGAKKNTITLTVPEGYSIERIKARVVELGLCTDSEFEAALKKNYDYSFISSVPQNNNINYRLQGFLYPSTYEFYADATAETVIETMLSEFEKQVSPLGISPDKMYDTITIASLVEREAKLDSERATISGVIKNRIMNDMPLQIDATVVYAISDGMYDVERVFYKDLETDSKYNTYKYKGLPAGPICCPGISSIRAAQNPQNHSFLYYHTDTSKNDGSHIFTETYDEHTSTMN